MAAQQLLGREPSVNASPRPRLYPNTAELRRCLRKLMDDQGFTSGHQLANRSAGTLNQQTINTILSGRVQTVRGSTLERLAELLRVEVHVLLQLVSETEPWILPRQFDEVPVALRRNIENALSEILKTSGIIK